MKLPVLFIVLLASYSSFAGDDRVAPAASIVNEEYEKTQAQYQKTYQENEKLVATLEQAKADLIKQSKEEAAFYKDGAEAFAKYDMLLLVRGTDERAEYHPGAEVSSHDIGNLNTLSQKYLKSTLLSEKASSRLARKAIAKAINQLREKAADLEDPSESNNAQLEIIAKKIEDAKRKNEMVAAFAKTLGIELKRELASPSAK